jgi:hypothetical protein
MVGSSLPGKRHGETVEHGGIADPTPFSGLVQQMRKRRKFPIDGGWFHIWMIFAGLYHFATPSELSVRILPSVIGLTG